MRSPATSSDNYDYLKRGSDPANEGTVADNVRLRSPRGPIDESDATASSGGSNVARPDSRLARLDVRSGMNGFADCRHCRFKLPIAS